MIKEMKAKAKRESLKDVIKDMKDIKGDKYKKSMEGPMSVKVVADSPEGLKEGLDKAKETLPIAEQIMKARGLAKKDEEKEEASEDYEDKEEMRKKIAMLEAKLKDMA